MRCGTTLLELVLVLTLVAAALSLAGPRLALYRDQALVRSAREQVIGVIADARTRAIARGRAEALVRAFPPEVSVTVDGVVVRRERLGEEASAPSVELPSGRASVELTYDGLGLGRFASTTIVLRRGEAEAAVVVSSYGRVRRR